MITKQEAGELIFAGVLGCLDRTDLSKLNEFLKNGGELPSTIGEFQNIAAMLPVMLKAENPPSVLKDKVARKLYRVKDEIRAKVVSSSLNRKSGSTDVFYQNSRENRKSSTLNEKLKTKEPEKFKIENDPANPEIEEEKTLIPEEEKLIIEEDIEEISPEDFELNEQEPEIKEEAVNESVQDIEIVKEPLSEPEPEKVIPPADDFEPVTPSRNTFESFKSTREKVIDKKFEEIEDSADEISEENTSPQLKVPTREKIKTYEKVSTKEDILRIKLIQVNHQRTVK